MKHFFLCLFICFGFISFGSAYKVSGILEECTDTSCNYKITNTNVKIKSSIPGLVGRKVDAYLSYIEGKGVIITKRETTDNSCAIGDEGCIVQYDEQITTPQTIIPSIIYKIGDIKNIAGKAIKCDTDRCDYTIEKTKVRIFTTRKIEGKNIKVSLQYKGKERGFVLVSLEVLDPTCTSDLLTCPSTDIHQSPTKKPGFSYDVGQKKYVSGILQACTDRSCTYKIQGTNVRILTWKKGLEGRKANITMEYKGVEQGFVITYWKAFPIE